MNPKVLIVIAFSLYGFYYGWTHRELKQIVGVLAAEAPRQIEIPGDKQRALIIKDQLMEPLAEYSIKARVLSTERYWLDRGAKVSPVDLALGWGPMSDSAVVDKLKIRQSDRFFFYSWSEEPPISAHEINLNSANVHIIPGDETIRKQALALRTGQVVEMTGQLVRVNSKDGGEWKSSLSREDSGDGACELFYVTNMIVRDR